MKPRIMYIESKSDGLTGPARIGRVTFSKTGMTIYYGGKSFRSLKGDGFKENYYDVETGDRYWISGPRRDGNDCLYPGVVDVDADVREEYWRDIRQQPEFVHVASFRSAGKYSRRKPHPELAVHGSRKGKRAAG